MSQINLAHNALIEIDRSEDSSNAHVSGRLLKKAMQVHLPKGLQKCARPGRL